MLQQSPYGQAREPALRSFRLNKAVIIALGLVSIGRMRCCPRSRAGNVFFGYSCYNANLLGPFPDIGRANANGWEGTLEGRVLPWPGINADFRAITARRTFAPFARRACPAR